VDLGQLILALWQAQQENHAGVPRLTWLPGTAQSVHAHTLFLRLAAISDRASQASYMPTVFSNTVIDQQHAPAAS